MALLEQGAPVPEFAGTAETGMTVRLSQFRERWGVVLFFFARDGMPGCTKEQVDFQQRLEEFRRLGYEVIGVSSDSVQSHFRIKHQLLLRYWLLSDPLLQIAYRLGVGNKELIVGGQPVQVAARETLIIDRQGRLVQRLTDVLPEGHAEAVLNLLRGLAATGA